MTNEPLTTEQLWERKRDFQQRKAHLFDRFDWEREAIQEVLDETDELLGIKCPPWTKGKPHE